MECIRRILNSIDENISSLNATNVTEEEIDEYRSCLSAVSFRNRWPVTVYLCLVAVVGFIGNALVMIVYWQSFEHSASRIFVLAMAIEDMTTSVIALPLQIITIRYSYDTYSYWLCRGMFAAATCPTQTSGLILVAVALDRFSRIWWPQKKHITEHQCYVINMFIFFFAHVLFGGFVPLYGINSYPSHIENVSVKMCGYDDEYQGTTYPKAYQYVIEVIIFGNLLLMTTSYILIGIKVWKRKTPIKKSLSLTAKSFPCCSSEYPVHSKLAGEASVTDVPQENRESMATRGGADVQAASGFAHNITVVEVSTVSYPLKSVMSTTKAAWRKKKVSYEEEHHPEITPYLRSTGPSLPTNDLNQPYYRPNQPLIDPELPSNDPNQPLKDLDLPSNDPNQPLKDPELPSDDPNQPLKDPNLPSKDGKPPLTGFSPPFNDPNPQQKDLNRNSNDLSPPLKNQNPPSNDPNQPMIDPNTPSNNPNQLFIDPNPPSNDPNQPLVDPNPPSNNPNQPLKDPNLPSYDLNQSLIDPNPPSNDPNQPLKDPNLPSNDPNQPLKDPNLPFNDLNQFFKDSNPPSKEEKPHATGFKTPNSQQKDLNPNSNDTSLPSGDPSPSPLTENLDITVRSHLVDIVGNDTAQESPHAHGNSGDEEKILLNKEDGGTSPRIRPLETKRQSLKLTNVTHENKKEESVIELDLVSIIELDDRQFRNYSREIVNNELLSQLPFASSQRKPCPQPVIMTETVSSHTRKIQSRTTLMMAALTFFYVVNWMPHCYIRLTGKYPPNWCPGYTECGANISALSLRSYYLNSAVNAFVYSFCSTHFRNELGLMFERLCRRFRRKF